MSEKMMTMKLMEVAVAVGVVKQMVISLYFNLVLGLKGQKRAKEDNLCNITSCNGVQGTLLSFGVSNLQLAFGWHLNKEEAQF